MNIMELNLPPQKNPGRTVVFEGFMVWNNYDGNETV